MAVTRLSLALLLPCALFAGCATTDGPDTRPGPVVEDDRPPVIRPVDPAETDPQEVEPDEVDVVEPARPDAPVLASTASRLALLLPFTSENPRLREEAASMLQAAELALFARDADDVELTIHDTRGTTSGARAAVHEAREADVILGPVLAGEVREVGRAADVPVLAFSTDTSVAGDGTYLLSFPPEAEVERVVQYAAREGVRRFAILHPSNAYGRRVADAFRDAVARAGGQVVAAESYAGSDITAMQDPAQRLAQQYGSATDGRSFQAVLLPEGGTALRSVAPLLTYYNPRASEVLLMGTALWMREDTAREPALRNGIFAGPDETAARSFASRYRAEFGSTPSRLASQAYDAVGLGAVIAQGDPDRADMRAINPEGYYGADGFIRFRPDGTPVRGLAVYRVGGGTYRVEDPAPTGAIGSN